MATQNPGEPPINAPVTDDKGNMTVPWHLWCVMMWKKIGAGSALSLAWGSITGTLSAQADLVAALAAKVGIGRSISTTAPLTGGGDLSADLTLAVSTMVGDSGTGGSRGVVPAPGAGDAAASKFLKADGTWTPVISSVPTGTGFRHVTSGAEDAAAAKVAIDTTADTSMSDVTTNNVSTTKHGFAPKSPNDATKFLDGTGAYSVPAGTGGSGTVTHTAGALDAHKVVIGNGTDDVKVIATGSAGQYLRSGGASADPAMASIAESEVTNLVSDLAAKAPASRIITTTAPLTGGGDLSADRTLDISNFGGDSGSGGTKGAVPAPSAGDTAAGKFLQANGGWGVPVAGGGSFGTYVSTPPTSPTSSGVKGNYSVAGNVLYICDAANHWTQIYMPNFGNPDSIRGLVGWWAADKIAGFSNGAALTWWDDASINVYRQLRKLSTGAIYNTGQLNGLPAVAFNGTNAIDYAMDGVIFSQLTVFAVFKVGTAATSSAFISGVAGSFEYRIGGGGTFIQQQALTTNTTLIGVGGSASMAVGTWYQANVSYNMSTGVFAFRVARASDGGGTNVVPITVASTDVGFNGATNTEFFNGSIAELIAYNRVLSSTEIATIETYLNTKWGV